MLSRKAVGLRELLVGTYAMEARSDIRCVLPWKSCIRFFLPEEWAKLVPSVSAANVHDKKPTAYSAAFSPEMIQDIVFMTNTGGNKLFPVKLVAAVYGSVHSMHSATLKPKV